jgi:PBP1b-binding outer membrane lipoprotein LpoB
MKKIRILALLAITIVALSGCLSTSPVGVNCVQGTPFLEMPVACIGGN